MFVSVAWCCCTSGRHRCKSHKLQTTRLPPGPTSPLQGAFAFLAPKDDYGKAWNAIAEPPSSSSGHQRERQFLRRDLKNESLRTRIWVSRTIQNPLADVTRILEMQNPNPRHTTWLKALQEQGACQPQNRFELSEPPAGRDKPCH